MSELHVLWTPPLQPATRWKLDIGDGHEHWIEWSPYKRVRCHKCYRVRQARNMQVREQAYYDPMFTCVACPPKKGRARKTLAAGTREAT